LHVCGLPELHCFSLAVHARHWPALQGVVVQVVTVCRCPDASHDCTVVLAHWYGPPGVQSPPQRFVVASQTNVQACGAPQCPAKSQISSMLVEPVEQRVAPGLQSPAQTPSEQTLGQLLCG
jgi:hypothetical protein